MMMRDRLLSAGMLGALAACAACSVAQAQSDQIFGSRGTPTRGTIQAMSADEVTIKTTGVDRAFQVNEILKVTYSDDPGELRTARDRVMAGQLEDALTLLTQIKLPDDARSVLQQDLEYYRAFCQAKLALAGDGDKAAAASAMFAFVRANGRKSYHFYEANEILGDLAAAMGRFDTAVRFYGDLGTAPWGDYKLRAAVRSAQSLTADQKFSEALQRYQQVIDSNVTGPAAVEEKQLAQAGKANCLAETGNPQEGLKLAQSLIANNDPKDARLFGRTYNAMGACYRKMDQPKDAILAYLHTDILFYKDADAHAEALYNLHKLWSDMKNSDRSVSARTLLQSRYAGSFWAAKK